MNDYQLVIISQNEIEVIDDITRGLLRLVDYDLVDKWAMLFHYNDGQFKLVQRNRCFCSKEIELLSKATLTKKEK